MAARCKICDASRADPGFLVPDNMFGSGRTFYYHQCRACRSVWTDDSADDDPLAGDYPDEYYSFASSPNERTSGVVRRALQQIVHQRNLSETGRRSPVGWLAARIRAEHRLRSIGRARLGRDARILDVGCGAGFLLRQLKALGFGQLTGVDPYLPDSLDAPDGIALVRADIGDVEGSFDAVMFHHSLEHMEQPRTQLDTARRLLAPGGVCIVRIPTTTSRPFEKYHDHWIQLDAPRHRFVPSRTGIALLAEACGFRVESCVDDSTSFGYLGSEMGLQRVPISPHAPNALDPGELFSAWQRLRFGVSASIDNRLARGDQISCLLRPLPAPARHSLRSGAREPA